MLSCLLVACGDDAGVTSDTEGTTSDEDTTDSTVTTPTTTINPTSSPSTSSTATETDSDSSSGETTDGTTTNETDPTDDTTTSVESSSSTGDEPICGDDEVNGSDECDGVDLDLQNCVALDFDGGTLACTNECIFDTSGCTTCGDDMAEGDEECDGGIGAATCVSEGFVSGTLACANDCTFDTSDCSACGDGNIDAGEDCDMDDLGGTGCLDLVGFTGGTLSCDVGCGFDTTSCTNFALPAPGEIVISEILQNPTAVGDPDGEWFEVHNPSAGTTYQLGGCTIDGNMSDTPVFIDVDVELGPGGYVLFGDDTALDPGIAPAFEWIGADFGLNNGTDRVAIVCDGSMVDEVSYDDGGEFPDPAGASMNLDPGFLTASDNDVGANWCPATTNFNGDLGTPGAANIACDSETTYTIGFCRLQFPVAIDEAAGTDVDVFGRVFVSGLTDLTGTNDPAPEVIGYVGYGPDGTDPAVDATWVWTVGAPNPGYGPASPGYEANNDEYQATLGVPGPAGDYDFAFRFSGDSGSTFLYCDGGNAGSSDGYAAADAGQMTSTAADVANMYFSEYVEGAVGNNKAIEIFNADTVSGDLDLCVINRYTNGAAMPSATISPTGMLAAGGTYVVCHTMISDSSNCDLLTATANWNGNDAIELVCGGVTLDAFGRIGEDPGVEWSGGGVGTADEVLRRDCSVTTGDTNGLDAFDPSAQWDTFVDTDLSDLGQYVCP